MAELIDLPFGLWKHKLNNIRQVAPKCRHGRAYWRHLANTIEPSACGGDDTVLCQITLTNCYCLLFVCFCYVMSVCHAIINKRQLLIYKIII